MKDEIICQRGKCTRVEDKNLIHFEEMFRQGNIVDDIEKDLWQQKFNRKNINAIA